jgi:LCP family protein required for cell wall assembly
MLNAVYTYATEHAALYPGVTNPGAQATKEAVEGVTGLTINYWALIDLKGFEALVNAVGGITLDINKRVPIGGGSTKISGYIETGKHVELDGYHALWFARSRADSSDYERMARQKCVMSAMLNQLDPMTVLTKFNQIAAAGKEIVATDIPTSTINTLMQLALKAKKLPISSLSFVPPLVYPGSPNFTVIHAAVQAKIDAAEGADRGEKPVKRAEPASRASSDPSTESDQNSASSATAEPSTTAGDTPKPGQDTEDLAEVCAAR